MHIVQYLLDNKASVNARCSVTSRFCADNSFEALLILLFVMIRDKFGGSSLDDAVRHDQHDVQVSLSCVKKLMFGDLLRF